MSDSERLLSDLQDCLVSLRQAEAEVATRRAIDGGVPPPTILEEGLTPAMLEVGRRWDQGRMFIPQVMVAARIFARCTAQVAPHMKGSAAQRGPRVVLATVKGDVHDLGKSIVGSMFRACGCDVHDLGKDRGAGDIVDAVAELRPAFVGLSAMLTSTMRQQETIIRELDRAGLRGTVKVIVGGAPISARFAREIGADGYGANAGQAVRLLHELG